MPACAAAMSGRSAPSHPRLGRWMLLGGLVAGLAIGQLRRPGLPMAGDRPARASLRIVDGDTFVLAGLRIRIADIDTPEPRGRCPAERALGRAAAARLKQLLEAGPYALTRIGRDEDRYGRKLRIVTRDGRSLGERLIVEGLARRWNGRRAPWCDRASPQRNRPRPRLVRD